MPNTSTVTAYRDQLAALLPRGAAWAKQRGSMLLSLLESLAVEAARVDEHGGDLLVEMIPDTTLEMLADWERVAGLPDDCVTDETRTIETRRAALLTKLRSLGGQSRQYFIDLAAVFGFTITITEFKPFRAGSGHSGDPVCSEAWAFAWRVNAPTVTVTPFRAGAGAAGEPLRIWGNARLECLLSRYKPAHTEVLFAYSG